MRALAAAVKHEVLRLADPVVRRDPHNPGYLVPALLERLVQPWRAYRLRRFIRASAHTYDAFGDQEFCLFPLHFEPEIALQIYGRPLQNQIEVARTLALALPVGMKLVVKEHPRAAGFRPLGYYRRLLDIPNVLIAAPELSSQRLVRDAGSRRGDHRQYRSRSGQCRQAGNRPGRDGLFGAAASHAAHLSQPV